MKFRALTGLGLLLASGTAAWAQEYVISTIAGGAPPPTPVAAVNANIGPTYAVAADAAGNVYFNSDNCVFRLDQNGALTRVAGNSRVGYSGDGGPAVNAQLNYPLGMAVDGAGNLFIAERNRIPHVCRVVMGWQHSERHCRCEHVILTGNRNIRFVNTQRRPGGSLARDVQPAGVRTGSEVSR